jgi:hypothetical protein
MESQTSGLGLLTQWLFGSLVVLLYALDRFETPLPARATTTFTRYWVARTGYVLSMFLLYLLLAGAFTDVAPILRLLTGVLDQKIGDDLQGLPGPLFAALLLTSLLPHIPHLKRIDEAVKHWFQRLGNIPLEVRALSGQLRHTRVSITPEMMARLRPILDDLGIDEEKIYMREDTFVHRWAKIAALYASIRQWEDAPVYMRYVVERKSAFDEIEKRVQAMRELDETALISLGNDDAALRPWRARMSEELTVLHQQICDYIAGGLLQTGWSPRQRNSLLAEMGFEVTTKPVQSLTAHDVVLVGGIIFLMMLFLSLVLNQNIRGTDLAANINMRVMFMVPIIYCVAIVAAIYPKTFWPIADIRLVGRRPMLGYVASGLLAAAVTFLIQLLFRYAQGGVGTMIEPGSFTKAIATNLDRWPWLLMNFLMTIAIAWIADNHALSKRKETGSLRLLETLSMAGVCGLLQWMTLQLLLMYSKNPARWDGRVNQMILTTALVGAVIGFLVPHFYRVRGSAEIPPPAERPHRRLPSSWMEAEIDEPG